MKKIIILLLALLMSACSAVKPSETLSSMQTESTEMAVADTQVTEITKEPIPKENETVIETPKTETTALTVENHPEQKPIYSLYFRALLFLSHLTVEKYCFPRYYHQNFFGR